MTNQKAKHHSQSLQITIAQIERYMEGHDDSINGDLQDLLYKAMAETSKWWLQEGFSLAHQQCLDNASNGAPLKSLSFKYEDGWLAPGITDSVDLKSPHPNHPDI